MHGANMMTEVHSWMTAHFPWWARRGGRDHIWLMSHDEGACWMPKFLYDTSIVLTHWGRTDINHTSNTAFHPVGTTRRSGWLDGSVGVSFSN